MSKEQCLQEPASDLLTWLKYYWEVPDDRILQKCGPDAFLFLRYIKMMLKIFLPLMLVIIPALTPINYRSGELGEITLKSLTISNIQPRSTANRLWAHWTLSVLVVSWACYVIHSEISAYVDMRQKCFSRRSSCTRTASNTILVGNIPESLLEAEKLKGVFGAFQGGVKDVHINTNIRGLSKLIKERQRTRSEVERAHTDLIVRYASKPRKAKDDLLQRSQHTGSYEIGEVYACETRGMERETMRLPRSICPWLPGMPHFGKKVDRIECLLARLDNLNQQIHSLQANLATSKPTGSAFIQFRLRIAAHLACQSVVHGTPYKMTPRILEVDPEDIIWSNVALGWRQRWFRNAVGVAISCAVIVLYAVPIAFVSLLADLDKVASDIDWLAWLSDWPDAVKNFIQGVLPSALLQLLLLLVPAIYRSIVHFQGPPTGNIRDTAVQHWHFLFLFVQVCQVCLPPLREDS